MTETPKLRLVKPPICPICGQPATPQHKPFCSRRCADIDLGRWLKESYRIPAGPDRDEDDSLSEADRPPPRRP
jgi:endogenous inhibitor of DNA gyrase (YacG/DUF329 family)